MESWTKKYHKNRYLRGVIFPSTYYNDVLFIDTSPGRWFNKVKDRLS